VSQYLKRIEESLASTHDPFLMGELKSRKAAYMARIGNFEDAKHLISEIRSEFFDGRSGRVTCLLMLAEAAVMHFEHFNEIAQDRIARALLLAQGMRDAEIIGLSAAWKAYIDFELSRFESMRIALKASTDAARENDHTALTRCALLKVLGAEFLGWREAAKHWFKIAHGHAIADGDQASIDALIFNKAAFALARQRLEWSRGCLDANQLPILRSELQSAKNLCLMVGITSFEGHIELSLARLETLRGDFMAAHEIYRSLESMSGFKPRQASVGALRIESAYCQLGMGQLVAAKTVLTEVDANLVTHLDPDEQVVILRMWTELVSSLGTSEDHEMARTLSAQAKTDYEKYESRLKAALEGLM
jgi:hypothetical protein